MAKKNAPNDTVILRASASPRIGGGHVIRCITLANALLDAGYRCIFASGLETTKTIPALERSSFEITWLDHETDGDGGVAEAENIRSLHPGGCRLLVVDHYSRDRRFEEALRDWAEFIVVLDDVPNRRHDCDMLLDQSGGRKPEEYQGLVAPTCRLLLGPGYALVRDQFGALRDRALERPTSERLDRVFVSMGAADPENWTQVVLKGIALSRPDVCVDVMLAANAPHINPLKRFCETSLPGATFHTGVTDVADIMWQADLAVGTAGINGWERCCLGLPSLVSVAARNQEGNAAELISKGAALDIGRVNDLTAEGIARAIDTLYLDHDRRDRMRRAAAEICDGAGAVRVADKIIHHMETRPA